jgi:hypothetical protein
MLLNARLKTNILCDEFAATLPPLERDLWEAFLAVNSGERHSIPRRAYNFRISPQTARRIAYVLLPRRFRQFLASQGVRSLADVGL